MPRAQATRRAFARTWAFAFVLCVATACQVGSLFDSPDDDPSPTGPGAAKATRIVLSNAALTAIAGIVINPAVRAIAYDDDGNVVVDFAGDVAVALVGNNTGGVLSGTTTRAAVNGVATFSDLRVSPPGSYRLNASSPGLQSGPSLAFDVEPSGPPVLSAVSGNAQRDSVTAVLPVAYVVRVNDALGRPIAGVSIDWRVTGGGGDIEPSRATTDALGEARATHTLGAALGAQTVTASADDLAGSPAVFTASAVHAAPVRVQYMNQPDDTPMGVPIAPPVNVAVEDRFGNRATSFIGTVSISIAPGTGSPLASLSGTTTRQASGGTVSFGDLRINLPGGGYRLRASAVGDDVESQTFNIRIVGSELATSPPSKRHYAQRR